MRSTNPATISGIRTRGVPLVSWQTRPLPDPEFELVMSVLHKRPPLVYEQYSSFPMSGRSMRVFGSFRYLVETLNNNIKTRQLFRMLWFGGGGGGLERPNHLRNNLLVFILRHEHEYLVILSLRYLVETLINKTKKLTLICQMESLS